MSNETERARAETKVDNPFAAAIDYRAAGWAGTLPVVYRGKELLVKTYTGYQGGWPSDEQVQRRISASEKNRRRENIALRLPHGVIGIDVDDYNDKGGGATLADLVERFGALPKTVRSSSRGFKDGEDSGIRFYRVGKDDRFGGKAGNGIEIIQFHHRYAIVAPSIHPQGREYRWFDERTGELVDDVSEIRVEDLPELPGAWIEGLKELGRIGEVKSLDEAGLADQEAVKTFLGELRDGSECRYVERLSERLAESAARERGAAHDEVLRDVLALIEAGYQGHRGVGAALRDGRAAFVAGVADRSSEAGAKAEWRRMTRGGLAMKLAAGEKMASICVCDEPAKMRSDPANPFGAGVVLTDEELSAAKAEQDGGGDAGSGDAFLTEKEAIGAETVDGEGDEVRRPRSAGEFFTDARVAEALAREVCVGRFCYSPGLGWLSWTGKRWGVCSDEKVVEAVRAWVVIKVIECLDKGRLPGDVIHDGWKKMLGIRKIKDALALAKGIVLVEAHEFDADPDVLNTADGLVDLRTGQIKTHSPDMLVTKITSGGYRPGFTHEDWDTALRALPDGETRKYFQNRVGQAITGHRSPDGINMILQGGGENGKGVLVSDGLVPALGDYAAPASEKLIAGSMNDHSEEKADLRGQRLIVAEELTEDRVLNVTAIKRISDIATIKARHVYQRNMKFKTTHSLLATSNYRPVVNETDWGTWRRLELWFFPYTFCKSEAECIRPEDRVGDPGLKRRIENNQAHQHDAIVAWAVEGAMRWYAEGAAALRPSAWVQRYTKEWRRQADRIDGFWADRLIATEDEQIERCIPQMDLLDAFNDWLKSNGHRAWTKETFNQRFGSHRVTTEHKVEQKRVREPKSADRYLGFGAPEKLPDMVRVWVGVRFRTRKDDAAEEMAERGMSVVESENESSEDDESGDVFASSS